jgi:hypothetical protein
MQLVETGITGAKRQSWKAASPRDLLAKVVERYPNSNERFIRDMWERLIDEDSSGKYLAVVKEYWFANNYRSLVIASPVDKPKRDAAIQRKAAAIKTGITAKIEEKAKIILLDMVMPNGEKLRHCKISYCRKIGPKLGRFFTEIGRKYKPSEVVGQVLSEEEARQMYNR